MDGMDQLRRDRVTVRQQPDISGFHASTVPTDRASGLPVRERHMRSRCGELRLRRRWCQVGWVVRGFSVKRQESFARPGWRIATV
jgi:hypothetical protein